MRGRGRAAAGGWGVDSGYSLGQKKLKRATDHAIPARRRSYGPLYFRFQSKKNKTQPNGPVLGGQLHRPDQNAFRERGHIFSKIFGACRRRPPRPESDSEDSIQKVSVRRVFRWPQTDTGPRHSPSACSEIFFKKYALGQQRNTVVDVPTINPNTAKPYGNITLAGARIYFFKKTHFRGVPTANTES